MSLTDRQRSFAETWARTGDAAYAATRAGYANPDQAAVGLRRHAGVLETVRDRHEKLLARLVPIGLEALREVLEAPTALGPKSPGVPAVAKVAAAKIVLDRAGLSPYAARGEEEPEDERSADELTSDELRARLERYEGALADRARLVVSTMVPGEERAPARTYEGAPLVDEPSADDLEDAGL